MVFSVRTCSTFLLVLVGAVSAIEDRCNACLAVAAELDASIKKDYMSDDRLNILKGGRLDSKVSATAFMQGLTLTLGCHRANGTANWLPIKLARPE